MPQFGDNIKVKDGDRTERTVIDKYGRVYLNFEPGNQFFVNSATGSSANDGKTWDEALNTVANALLKVTASNSDVIWVAPGHAETIASATTLALNKAGVTVIGLGFGAMRPTLTFSATASNIPISAASVHVENILCVAGIDSIVAGITISAADVSLKNIEWRDVTDIEAILAILTTNAADRLSIDGFYHNGFVTGNACTDAIRLVGVDTGLIQNCRFIGNYGTAIVEFHTTACHKIYMDNNLFCETGTTNYSKNVVDTATGSTWYCRGYDLAAGKMFGGGSGAALAAEDATAVASDVAAIKVMTDKVGTITNTAGTATIGAILGDFANSSLVTRVGAIKTEVDKIGTVVNSGGTATLGGALGDFANSSLVTRIAAINADVGDASERTNLQSLLAILGNPDASGATLWSALIGSNTTYNAKLGTKIIKTKTDILDGTQQAMFTVANGRVLVTNINLEVCDAAVDAGANNTQIKTNPTVGTDAVMCAVLDVNADEAGTIYSITGEPGTALQGGSGGGANSMISPWIVPEGTIDLTSAADGGVGGAKILCELWYIPLDSGATVTASV